MKLTPGLALIFVLFALLGVTVGLVACINGPTTLKAATVTELETTAGEKEACSGFVHRESGIL